MAAGPGSTDEDGRGGKRQRRGTLGSGTLWIAWTILILAVTTLPWSQFTTHPHWEKVDWIPFRSGAPDAWEMAANVALFVPFGYLGRRYGTGRRFAAASRSDGPWTRLGLALPLAAGLVLSAGVELVQVFIHGRFPSADDVVANVAGVAVGIIAAALEARWGLPWRRR